MTIPQREGGRILVDALKIHQVDTVFCVPGESYLPVLDALYDEQERLRLIVCRQEGGAAFMAEAYGKLTGRPGVCFVTRGPGATNAGIGVHTARQDSTPLVLFVGQVGGRMVEREAFQEIDYRRMFGQMAKWVAQIDRVERIPEMVSHAFHLAVSGRPGPVVLALPEDVLSAVAAVPDCDRYRPVQAHPGPDALRELRERLAAAQRPLLILGGGGWSAEACAAIRRFSEANRLPTLCTFRRQDLYDNRLPNYVGDLGLGVNPRLAERVRQADLLLAVGPRLGETTTGGYQLLDIPRPRQTLIHVHAGAEELGRVYRADLPINAGMAEFAAAVSTLPTVEAPAWQDWLTQAREDYLSHLQPPTARGELDLAAVIAFLNRRLPAEAILTNGAGNYSAWLHRFYQYRGFRTQLAPTSGAMGYGVPAAVAAKLAHPERPVVCLAGDGCFQMNGQELATAVRHRLAIIFLVCNNGMYGTIRMHQERRYPGRVCGTDLANPDFAALARAYGAHGETVDNHETFVAAFERALTLDGPALIELRTDPRAITPDERLEQS
ncbi:thiamine pyrophosphate-binding protein [Geothermobacter hydrogeniphilus]|uniref:Thiamine pyrophosphate-binding protein n=1 Tax=Geothermobacter hydrogeniphilus TaxID=1969733 RepID=A0A1X0Y2D0_9BACT|nr:thiamine pyrophosphate-binding protein [Geothermobacter hydrogeniphilus]ORJ59258.1 thiamine pyrophosphate-binding protein [Geothermobacter hydrogeniphilus]